MKLLSSLVIVLFLAPLAHAATSPTIIDNDHDGYGVGSPLGPDANDSNAAINTTASVLSTYGTVQNYYKQTYGLTVNNTYYIAPNGNDATGKANDPTHPFATEWALNSVLKPGDAALFQAGTYTANSVIHTDNLHGTAAAPIIIQGMPGAQVNFIDAFAGAEIRSSSNLLIGNYKNTNPYGTDGAAVGIWFSSGITAENVEGSGNKRGVFAMYDLHDITIRNMSMHDNWAHGMYIGAPDQPNSNITVQGSIVYNNGYHGIQHNGRVTNLQILNNKVFSNGYAGVSLVDGVSNSRVAGNTIFNNTRQGIVMYAYNDTPDSGILPYDQTGNVIEGNTVWVGKTAPDGSSTEPNDHAAIQMTDDSGKVQMTGNIIRNNILYTQNGAVIRLDQSKFQNNTITNNRMYRTAGIANTLSAAGVSYTAAQLAAYFAADTGNQFVDPQFADVSVDYWSNPDLFNFNTPLVPEPASMAFLAMGAVGLLFRKRHIRK
jgi:parallel beta-helix repeat protein